jgi:heme exporter protein CcmD
MPDLGKYADTVFLAYIVSAIFLVGLISITWLQSKRAKRLLAEEEKRHGK